MDVDILVLAFDEESSIRQNIRSLAAQVSSGCSYEVRVVILANGCTDGTIAAARSASSEFNGVQGICFEVCAIDERGRANALNHGLAGSHTDFVMYCHADVTFSPGVVASILDALEDSAVVAGPKNEEVINPIVEAAGLGGYYRLRRMYKEIRGPSLMPSGRMLGFRRGLVDMFPLNVAAEDVWICCRAAQEYGWDRVDLLEDVAVYHRPPTNWLDLLQTRSRDRSLNREFVRLYPELAEAARIREASRQMSDAEIMNRVESIATAQGESDGLNLFRSLDVMIEDNVRLMSKDDLYPNNEWEKVKSARGRLP